MFYQLTQIDGFFFDTCFRQVYFSYTFARLFTFFFNLIYSIQTQNFKVLSKSPLYLCYGKLLSTELFLIINLFDWL